MTAEDLTGKSALVTGAGSGIGQRIARRLAARGAFVVLAGRRRELLQATAEAIARENGSALPAVADVADKASVGAMVGQALDATGRLDIAINAAGALRLGPVDEFALEDFQAILTTNVTGTWLCLKHEIRAVKRAARGGAIVNIASNVGAHLARPGASAYAASKAAVAAMTRTAALEAIGHGIRINGISPGPVDTAMLYRPGEDRQARDARIGASNPSGRVATLDEIAEAALWLCTDAAGYLVGHDLVVDGVRRCRSTPFPRAEAAAGPARVRRSRTRSIRDGSSTWFAGSRRPSLGHTRLSRPRHVCRSDAPVHAMGLAHGETEATEQCAAHPMVRALRQSGARRTIHRSSRDAIPADRSASMTHVGRRICPQSSAVSGARRWKKHPRCA